MNKIHSVFPSEINIVYFCTDLHVGLIIFFRAASSFRKTLTNSANSDDPKLDICVLRRGFITALILLLNFFSSLWENFGLCNVYELNICVC